MRLKDLRMLVMAGLALPGLLTPALVAQRLGNEFQVNTQTSAAQRFATVAVAASGNFVVVWQSSGQDGSGYGVFARRFTSAGVGLASEFQVNTYTGDGQIGPSVAAQTSGDFVVVWVSVGGQDGAYNGIFARRFSSAGAGLASEFQVNTYTLSSQYAARVAALPSGEFVIAWTGVGDGSYNAVLAQRFSSTGARLASEFLVNSHTEGLQMNPAVGAGASGDFVVAWVSSGQDGPEGYWGVFARRFSSTGAAIATEFQVNSYTDGDQEWPAVTAAASGDFVVVWASENQDGDEDGAFAQRFSSAGTALGSEFRVSTHTVGFQEFPKVAAGADGDFVVAWDSGNQDGSDYGVFARSFSSAGTPLASEFQVNTYTTSAQYYAGVGAASSGNFVVVWHSNTQDGSYYGIFGQRFASPKKIDVDGDGAVLPLTDGLLVLRSTFGFTGAVLTNGVVNLAGCTRCDAAAIEAYLKTLN